MATAQIRFRHTAGDVGPLTVDTATPVSALKERLLAEWPAEGPLAAERPAAAAEIRLIGAGKFLEPALTLKGAPARGRGRGGRGRVPGLARRRQPRPRRPLVPALTPAPAPPRPAAPPLQTCRTCWATRLRASW